MVAEFLSRGSRARDARGEGREKKISVNFSGATEASNFFSFLFLDQDLTPPLFVPESEGSRLSFSLRKACSRPCAPPLLLQPVLSSGLLLLLLLLLLVLFSAPSSFLLKVGSPPPPPFLESEVIPSKKNSIHQPLILHNKPNSSASARRAFSSASAARRASIVVRAAGGEEGKKGTKTRGERNDLFFLLLLRRFFLFRQPPLSTPSSPKLQRTERRPWELRRFVSTLLWFNPPARIIGNIFKLGKKSSSMAPPSSSASSSDDGIFVVTGATGGLGRRVVSRLLAQGKHVRAVARDPAKASELLGSLPVAAGGKLEVVFADLAQPRTIPDSLFAPDAATGRGVSAVLSCSAVKVQPKEGDTPDRSKYLQGIKFYDPELADDSPAAVELGGVTAILSKAARALGASEAGWPLFDAGNPEMASPIGELGALDDVVMGGASRSRFEVVEGAGEGGKGPAGVFRGTLTDANSGGFASVRSRNCDPPLDLSRSACLALRVRGDGRRYKLILRTDPGWDSLTYCASFDTRKPSGNDDFETVRIPWSSFKPVFRAKSAVGAPPLDPSRVASLQLMLSKFEYDGALNPTHTPGTFDFELRVSKIVALAESSPSSSSPSSAPRRRPAFVHVSSAGVTRPNRPGINVDEEPPAVKMNAMLGGLLDYKLAAEDAIRRSGIPFAIVRPVALTEEPRGMPVSLDQGDTVRGKVSREDVADLVLALLRCPEATGTTFEVRSSVPFSEPWQGVASADGGFEGNDWGAIVASAGLRRGVTGKTVDGVYGGKEVEKGWKDPLAESEAVAV